MNAKFKNLKDNEEEMKMLKENPLCWYNTYVRKKGHRELTQEEYDELVRQVGTERYFGHK